MYNFTTQSKPSISAVLSYIKNYLVSTGCLLVGLVHCPILIPVKVFSRLRTILVRSSYVSCNFQNNSPNILIFIHNTSVYRFVNGIFELFNFWPHCFEKAGTTLNVTWLLFCLGETTNEGSVREQRKTPVRNRMKTKLRMWRMNNWVWKTEAQKENIKFSSTGI